MKVRINLKNILLESRGNGIHVKKAIANLTKNPDQPSRPSKPSGPSKPIIPTSPEFERRFVDGKYEPTKVGSTTVKQMLDQNKKLTDMESGPTATDIKYQKKLASLAARRNYNELHNPVVPNKPNKPVVPVKQIGYNKPVETTQTTQTPKPNNSRKPNDVLNALREYSKNQAN